MRLSSSLVLAAAGLAATALPAAATTRLVPQQYRTIQAAVNAAAAGDTVLVSAKPHGGVYREAVTVTMPSLRLQGVGNPVIDGTAFNTSTVKDPGSPYSFVFYTGATGITVRASHVTIAGFTVQNFGPQEAQDQYGAPTPASAGISAGVAGQASAPSDITISGCTLKNNYVGVSLNGGLGFFFDLTGFASGYRVLGCAAIGNATSGVSVTGDNVTVAAGAFDNNGGDGLDVFGEGLTVTGCDAGGNAGTGLNVDDYDIYNFPGSTPADEPAGPSTVALNAIHDNGYIGLETDGTVGVTGNSLLRNGVYGLYLSTDATGSTISGNVISGTTVSPTFTSYGDPGTGIFVYETEDPGNLTVSYNQIRGNAGDGIFFNYVSGSTIANNIITDNGVTGIHLSDYTSNTLYAGSSGYVPNTVTQNVALHNAQFDAFDDAAAPTTDSVTEADGTQVFGDGGATNNLWTNNLWTNNLWTNNLWTNNLFGKTDPPGLSH